MFCIHKKKSEFNGYKLERGITEYVCFGCMCVCVGGRTRNCIFILTMSEVQTHLPSTQCLTSAVQFSCVMGADRQTSLAVHTALTYKDYQK